MINTDTYVDFPANTVMVLMVVLGAKVAQKPFEKHEHKAVTEMESAVESEAENNNKKVEES